MRPQSLYLGDMLEAIDQIGEFISGLDFPEFSRNRLVQSAVIWQLVVVGEAARAIESSVRESYVDVPWKLLSGMRNRLTHAYFNIDYDIVWKVAATELPEFRPHIEKALKSTPPIAPPE